MPDKDTRKAIRVEDLSAEDIEAIKNMDLSHLKSHAQGPRNANFTDKPAKELQVGDQPWFPWGGFGIAGRKEILKVKLIANGSYVQLKYREARNTLDPRKVQKINLRADHQVRFFT